VIYDDASSTIYLNDEPIGMINNEKISHNYSKNQLAQSINSDSWVYFGSGSNRISWAKGTTTAVAAAVIAVPLAGLGAAGVIAAMGLGALGVLAASSVGGTVSTTIYKFNSPFINQFRYDWSFTASTGDYYEVYTYLR
jgi:hypothetical protein